jgi:hypothetical protein
MSGPKIAMIQGYLKRCPPTQRIRNLLKREAYDVQMVIEECECLAARVGLDKWIR